MSSSRFAGVASESFLSLQVGNRQAAVPSQNFQLSPRGVVFRSRAALPTWTEVSVCLHLPNGAGQPREQLECRGVVINCRRQRGGDWKCAVVFLNLSKKAETRLVRICPSSMEIGLLASRNGSSRSSS